MDGKKQINKRLFEFNKMNTTNKKNSRQYKRDGITSYLLVSEDSCNAKNITVTLVEMGKNGFQHIHSHKTEQSYFIIEGKGVMTVGNEKRKIKCGDCVFIPSNISHGLKNTGGTKLKYLSAGAPPFGKKEEIILWPIQPKT